VRQATRRNALLLNRSHPNMPVQLPAVVSQSPQRATKTEAIPFPSHLWYLDGRPGTTAPTNHPPTPAKQAKPPLLYPFRLSVSGFVSRSFFITSVGVAGGIRRVRCGGGLGACTPPARAVKTGCSACCASLPPLALPHAWGYRPPDIAAAASSARLPT
jgi:hypothetical protein